MEIKLELEDILAEIEEDRTWRTLELTSLKNNLSHLTKDEEKKIYRKTLVVMLYSHFEGFSKTALIIYLKNLNKLNLERHLVNYNLQASSLDQTFLEYSNNDKKNPTFKKELPDDSKLHKYSRQITFLEEFDDFQCKQLSLPDSIVDVESNLKPIVLQKILYRLGLDYDEFKRYDKNIHKLLNKRNSIAHGAQKDGIDAKDYDDLEKETLNLMDNLKLMIFEALDKKKFLK